IRRALRKQIRRSHCLLPSELEHRGGYLMAYVQYKGKNLYCFENKFRLLPGLNDVDDALLQKARLHPVFKRRVEAGIIVIMAPSRAGERMALSEMRKHIPQIFEKKMLEKIMKEDDRPEVQKLCLNQLDKIKHPAAGAKKENS